MAFGPNGVLYLNTWSGGYYQNDKPPDGGFLVALKDTKGDGRADVMARFGDGVAQGSAGGTGIRIYNGGLFAEQNDKIIRYPLRANGFVPGEQPHVIVSGLPRTGDHPMHPFIIDAEGHLFVDLGSAAAPVLAVMATMRKVRRRHRRSTLANGWIATAACREALYWKD